jgi:hypothetical protein
MVKKKYFFFLWLWLFSCYSLPAQRTATVQKLPVTVNSDAEETLPLLDELHNRLYFSRILHPENKGGKYSGSDIWYLDMSTQDAIPKKEAIDNLNDKKNNFVVGINNKDGIIYLNHPKSAEKGFQFSKGISDKWISPETIEIPGLPLIGYRGLYVTPDYKQIIVSMEGNDTQGKEDLYISLRNQNGDWSQPVNLGVTVNTSGREISPFLSADKSKLYFASDGHDGQGGMDIFEVERLYNSWNVWGKLRNLGPSINSPKFDAYYSVYGDTLAFFSSNRDSEFADIYEVRMLEPEIIKNRIKSVADANTIAKRNYLSQAELKDLIGFDILPSIDIKADGNISDNNVALELLYFLSNKLRKNPKVKMGIKVNVLQNMTAEKMVIEASNITSYIAAEMQKNSISTDRIQYEGVTIAGQEPSNEIAFRVKFSFFE